jgi:hypothetical protein
VAANIGGAVLVCLIAAPKKADIVDLEDQNDDPVDAGNDSIETEGSWPMIVLAPNRMAVVVVLAVLRACKGIVDSCYDDEQPGNDSKDLVGGQVGAGELAALCEGIV